MKATLAAELPDDPNGMRNVGSRDENFWYYRPENGESYEDLANRVAPGARKSCRVLRSSPPMAASPASAATSSTGITQEETVNWPIRQDALMYFSKGVMSIYSAAGARRAGEGFRAL